MTNAGSQKVLVMKYFCHLIVLTFSDECFCCLNSICRRIYFCRQKFICRRNIIHRPKIYRRRNLVLSLNNLYARNFISPPIDFQATNHFVANCFLFCFFFFFNLLGNKNMRRQSPYIYIYIFIYTYSVPPVIKKSIHFQQQIHKQIIHTFHM